MSCKIVKVIKNFPQTLIKKTLPNTEKSFDRKWQIDMYRAF